MIVFLAGMQRSGSTFSFNIVRELLNRRGLVYQIPSSSVIQAIEQSGNSSHVLFKAHNTDEMTFRMIELGSIKVLCTIRKPEDAIASWMQVFNFTLEESVDQMRSWLLMYRRLRPYACVIDYEQIDNHPWYAAWRIARFICSDATPFEIISAACNYSKKNVKRKTGVMSETDENIMNL